MVMFTKHIELLSEDMKFVYSVAIIPLSARSSATVDIRSWLVYTGVQATYSATSCLDKVADLRGRRLPRDCCIASCQRDLGNLTRQCIQSEYKRATLTAP